MRFVPIWMVDILAAAKRGEAVHFRAEHIKEDWFICIAEWSEGEISQTKHALRFRCDSDRKADFLAQELMREQIAHFSNETA